MYRCWEKLYTVSTGTAVPVKGSTVLKPRVQPATVLSSATSAAHEIFFLGANKGHTSKRLNIATIPKVLNFQNHWVDWPPLNPIFAWGPGPLTY